MAEKPMVKIQGLNSYYGKGKERRQVLRNVSLTLDPGEVLGIVGESGSGKSTLAKCLLGVVKDTQGTLEVNAFRPQMVFQDPYGSLNPAKSVGWFLEEPLRVLGVKDKKERKAQAIDMLQQVGLGEEHYSRRPSQLSGGQRQRVAIAAALIGGSRLIVLDEPVSALDVTMQAQILQLLVDLKAKYRLSYLFISHDLAVVYQICDRVAVMYAGRIVELAPTEELFERPLHPYTRLLLGSAPIPDPDRRTLPPNPGEVADAGNLPAGCAFAPRCPHATAACRAERPELRPAGPDHLSACPRMGE